MNTIRIPAGVNVDITKHESFEGKTKWRVSGQGIIQRAGVADNSIEALKQAQAAIIAKPVLVK